MSFEQASKLLGEAGKRLILIGGKRDIDIAGHVDFQKDELIVRLAEGGGQNITTSVKFDPFLKDRLRFHCDHCDHLCEHIGAMVSMILENKQTLGLAAPPKERQAVESLSEPQLIGIAIRERKERARGTDEDCHANPRTTVVRLRGHEHAQRQELPRCASGHR